MIDHYSYGTMTVNRRFYTTDLMIFPDGRVTDNWWRVFGHRLTEEDVALLVKARPDFIVAGMGTDGLMQAASGLYGSLVRHGIELIVEPTEAASRTFNALWDKKSRVAGCFHLAC